MQEDPPPKKEPITNTKGATIAWDFAIQTDKNIKSNRPHTVLKNWKRKTGLLSDMFVPTDNNISVKKYNKISKYKNLETEIEKMWEL